MNQSLTFPTPTGRLTMTYSSLALVLFLGPISVHGAVPSGAEPIHSIADPEADTGVSLKGILAYADLHAPALRVARQRLKLGDADLVAASPLQRYNPNLSIGAGPRMTGAGTYLDFQASVSQQLEVAGERGLRIEAAEFTRKRFGAQLNETRWRVHRDVHAAFQRGLVARERVAAAKRLLEFQESLVDIARRRLRAGDVSPLAVRLAEGELSQSRVSMIAQAQNYLKARLELGTLAGWPVGQAPVLTAELPVPRAAPTLTQLMTLVDQYQPRVRTLDAALAEAQAQVKVADRDGWPEPTLGVQLTKEGGAAGTSETVLMGTLSIPLSIVRRNQGARAQARAASQVALAEQAAFRAQLGNRVELHRSAVEAAAAQVEIYGVEILPQFEENLRLIRRAFELGEIDIVQVSVARARFINIQMDVLDAYTSYFQAFTNLEASVGTDLWSQATAHTSSKTGAQ